jgi:subtilisin family serine protease/subtilase family serine protease
MVFVSFVGKRIEICFVASALILICFLPMFFSVDLLRSLATNMEEREKPTFSPESTFEVPCSTVAGDRTQQAETGEDSMVPEGETVSLVVGLNRTCPVEPSVLAKFAGASNGTIIDLVFAGKELCAAVFQLSSGSVSSFTENLRKEGLASYVEPRGKFQTQFWPDDPYFSAQWGLQKIEADWAWNVFVGSRDVLVAVLDTGIDWHHPDLVDNYVPLGYDWVNDDADPMDDYGHGTHCAGTIAAAMNNGAGIAGMAQVRIMAEKILNNRGEGYTDWTAAGIYHAVEQGARVISMSFGDYEENEVVHEAIKYAYSAGVLMVACAGNGNADARFYPAAYDEVIAVAATDSEDLKASFSNFGDWVELAAPGVGVLSTLPNNDYQSYSGTSVSGPFVTGLCALVLSAFPNLSTSFVRYLLRYSADDLGESGFDEYYGYGRVNARKALASPSADHELVAFDLTAPPYLKPGAVNTVTAEIFNLGKNTENDVVVELFANGSLVWNQTVGSVASYDSVSVNMDLMPTVEGPCNITLYVKPLSEEANLENNVVTKFIYVGSAVKAVVLHSSARMSEEAIRNWNALNGAWQQFGSRMVYVDYMSLNRAYITYSDIVSTDADVLVITNAKTEEFDNVELAAIERYVYEGHGLIMTGDCFNWEVPNNKRLTQFTGLDRDLSLDWFFNKTDMVQIVHPEHPLFDKVPSPVVLPLVPSTVPRPAGEWSPSQLAGGSYLGLGFLNDSAIVEFKGLLYFSLLLETIPPQYHHHLQLLYNAVLYSRYQKPVDQLTVTLDSPRYVKPKETIMLNATVYNRGLKNETDVELILSIDGVTVNSTIVPELPSGSFEAISYSWGPTVEGRYNVSAYVPAVADEEQTRDNLDSSIIAAHFEKWILWDNAHTSQSGLREEDYVSAHQLLRSEGFIVHDSESAILSNQLLSGYDVLVLMTPGKEFSASEVIEVLEWVRKGGSLLVIVGAGFDWTLRYLTVPLGIQLYRDLYGRSITTDFIGHPITDGVDSLYIASAQRPESTSPSQEIVWVLRGGRHFSLVCASEKKEIVVISDPNIMTNKGIGRYDNEQLFMNVFHWLGTRHVYEHEVSLTLEVPAFVQRGQSATVNVTIRNKGFEDETGVKACLWVSGEALQFATVPFLQSGESYTLKYSWSPAMIGDFNFTAYVRPVVEENLTANNLVMKTVPVLYYERYYFANRRVESGLPMGWHSESGSWPYALTFDFPFCNHLYRTIYISTDGLITFSRINSTQDKSTKTFAGLLAVAPAFHDWSTVGSYGIYVEQADQSHVLIRWEVFDAQRVTASFAAEFGADGAIQFFYGFSNQSAAAVVGISNGEGYILAENVESVNNLHTVVYVPFELEHELSVTLQAPRLMSVGVPVLLNVTVSNLGSVNETGIALQLTANGSLIGSVTLSKLSKGSFNRTSVLWTPLTDGEYDLMACVSPVPGEVYTGDNFDSRRVVVVADSTTYVSFEPAMVNVAVGSEFTVSIYVRSVQNLYTWQIKLYYNQTVFQCVEAWLPSDHVFAYSIPLFPTPLIEGNYTLVGATLMGSEWPFTGSGTLCKIKFRSVKSGNCTMIYDDVDTYLLSSNMKPMDFRAVNGYAEASIPDFNNDGIVDAADMAMIASTFGTRPDQQSWNVVFDINHDSKVNMVDIAKTAKLYGRTS